MSIFLQCVVSGIAVGAIYSILAMSYTILFGTLRVANFAQGDIYMIGMLLGYTFYVSASLPFVVALIVSIIISIILLVVIERVFYRKTMKMSGLYLFMMTIGMSTFLRNGAQLIFGNTGRKFPMLFGSTPITLPFGVIITPQNLVIIIVAVILFIGLFIFMSKTMTGLAMSAVSINPFAASLMGVNFNRVVMITYGISAMFATIAGIFTAPIYNVTTTIGGTIGLKALVAAVLGGFGNSVGAIVGGVILGLVEVLGSTYISSAYKDAFAFILLIIILFVRPQGIFGRAKVSKV